MEVIVLLTVLGVPTLVLSIVVIARTIDAKQSPRVRFALDRKTFGDIDRREMEEERLRRKQSRPKGFLNPAGRMLYL